jgi:hypothetical protein
LKSVPLFVKTHVFNCAPNPSTGCPLDLRANVGADFGTATVVTAINDTSHRNIEARAADATRRPSLVV